MKKFLLSFVVSALINGAAAQGIAFEQNNDLNVALAKAKTEQKLIFIDAYAIWCGPCKMMDRDVFSQKAVGDYYNTHFVNLKLDMEAPENRETAKKYEVNAYPTFLFLNASGELIHKGLGAMSVEAFINLGRVAGDDTNNLAAISRKIAGGDMSYTTVTKYLEQNPYDKGNGALVDRYFSTLQESEIYRPEHWELFKNNVNSIDSYAFRYLLRHRAKINQLVGANEVDEKIVTMLAESYYAGSADTARLSKIDSALFAQARTLVGLSKAYGKFRKNPDDTTT